MFEEVNAVFADTYYFVGLINRKDRAHEDCVTFSKQFRGKLLTTELIVVELADALSGLPHRKLAGEFITRIFESPQVEVVSVSRELLRAGLKLFQDRSDKKWSLTDCVSFIVMENQKIHAAATGDHHFEQAGFKALLSVD